MDYALLPPEINSGRMYVGPGSGPMLAAAAAWDELAVELESAASAYSSVISGLTGQAWSGPAAVSMASAATQCVAWLSATAAQAEQSAIQAKAAAAAYEVAFAMTVPLPVIAANRALLKALIATNFFGQNTSAIAATEAQYMEMWAQDTGAMYGYASSSATASMLTPFNEPPQTTNPVGQGAQASTVSQAVGSATGTRTQALSQLAFSPLSPLGSPTESAGTSTTDPSVLSSLNTLASFPSLALGVGNNTNAGTENLYTNLANGLSFSREIQTYGGTIDGWLHWGRVGPYGALSGGKLGSIMSLGQAAKIGALSAPPSWAVAAPEIRPVALSLPASSVGAAPHVVAGLPPGSAFQEALMGTTSGRGALSRGTHGHDEDKKNKKEEKDERSTAAARVAPSGWLASSWAVNTRWRGVGR